MSMVVATAALTASSAASASIAQNAAREARKSACVVIESRFDPGVSSATEKQQYSECISLLYPEPVKFDEQSIMVSKGLVGIILICMVGCAIYGYKQGCEEWIDAFLGAIFGIFVGILVIILLVAIGFLFS